MDPTLNTTQEPEGGISLAPDDNIPQSPGEGISLASPTDVASSQPSTALAQKKADKFNYALGTTTGLNRDQIFEGMMNGREQALRSQAASDVSLAAQKTRSDIITQLINNGVQLTPEDIRKIYADNSSVDPSLVTEKGYAAKYLKSVQDSAIATGSKVLSDATAVSPEAVKDMTNKSHDIFTKMEIARGIQDDAQDTVEQQGWLPWLVDQAKSMTQLYPELKLRGQNPDVGSVTGGIGLGTNLQSQADALFNLPVAQFKDRLSTIYNGLKQDNPSLAKKFVDYVVGVGNSDKVLDNIFTIAAPFDAATVAKLGLSGLRMGSVELRAAKAFKDTIKSSAEAGKDMPISAAAAEGAGDINGAAAIRAQASLQREAAGSLDPEVNIKEKLPSNFNLDGTNLDNNYDFTRPGAMSREKMTRLIDSFKQRGTSLYDTLKNALRPNRTPVLLDDPVALKEFNDNVLRPQFKGVDNQILDFSAPKVEPITNSVHVEVHVGTNDGAYFSSPEVAKNNAELNGFKNVRIEEVKNVPVEVEPSELGGPTRARLDKQRLEGPEGSIAKTKDFLAKQRLKIKDTSLTKEAKAELAKTIKSTKEILDRYTKDLEVANSKVYMTDAKIEQSGLGYKYVVTKPFKENDDVVRNYLIKRGDGSYNPDSLSTGSMTGTQSWRNAAIGWFRGADDSLSVNEAIQRKAATYSRNLVQEWTKAETAKLEQVASGAYRTDPITGNDVPWYQAKARGFLNKIKQRQVFDEFNRVLKFARTNPDPDTGEMGYFFKTATELEDHYMRYYNRMPSYPEVQGYFAHVKLTEGDRVLREVEEFRNRVREGAEQHQVYFSDNKQRVGSGYFDGVQRNSWPSGNGQVLVLGERKGDERLAYVSNQKGGFNSTELERYREGINNGQYRVIEIYNPADYPLKSFSDIAGDNYIRYVVTNNADSKPLDFNHVNRRGGGHFEYDYDHYIKQAKIIPQDVHDSANDRRRLVTSLYVGDTTLMPISSRALGNDVAGKVNAVRELIAKGDWEGAEALGRKTLPMEWDEVQSWFKPTMKNGKKVAPKLDPNEPFVVVPKNKKVWDLDKDLEKRYAGTFQDATKSGSLAARNQVAYNVQRDADELMTVNRAANGNGAPIYQYEPADMIDPIPTMNRALNRAINSVFMNDYKQYAVSHWLEEAKTHLLADEREINASPFFHFEDTIDKSSFKPATDWSTVRNLLLNRMKIKQFVGMPNTFDTAVHSLTQHLVDAAYNKGGLTEKFSAIPIWLLSKAKDPVQIMRSIAFNAKLGMFNPAQLVVQAQTFANIWALEGRNGALGTYATMLHNMARYNSSPEMLAHLDQMATKFNMFGVKWRPGEFKEARELMIKRTGFDQVAGEHLFTDSQMKDSFIGNEWKGFLDAGQVFFREGERSTRVGAFYAAYKRFRDLHPVGTITDKDLGEILNRADLLTNNMSRASASNLHSGVFSLTSQFLSYQLHLMELMFGKRLGGTVAERNMARAKMFAVYSGLYGIPAASGLVGFPFGDSIREEAIKRGYVVGENWYSSLINEGIPAYLGFLASGNMYNFGSRFGSQGLTPIQDAMKSDNTIWKIAGGAGLSTTGAFASSLGNFMYVNAKWMLADNKQLADMGAAYKFKISDIVDMFKEISTVNQGVKAYYAMNAGRWISKNEQYIDDVSPMNGIFMSLLGVNPQRQDDAYHKINIAKAEKQAQEQAYKSFAKEYQRGILASKEGDQASSVDYMRRAALWLELAGYPMDAKAQAYARASKGYESMISSVDANFALRHVPADSVSTRIKQFETQYKMDQH